MCFPALELIGGVVSGVGAAMGASAQAASYRAQAAMNVRQADLEREQGGYQAARATEQGQKVVGSQVAAYGASGINPSTGTAKELIKQTGETAALDVAAIRYGSRVAQENQMASAQVNRMNASSASAAVPFAFVSPIISAFSSVGTPLASSYGSA